MTDPKLAFYGDDFTGSTDAMDALVRSGVRTVLFVDPPDRDDLAAFPDVDAVGVAGSSRSMTPAEMDDALPPAFESLAATGAPVIHYKVCSTFDSAPEVGSIGRAIDIGAPILDTPYVPLCVGVPQLERFVVFGHLFAAAGDGTVYRIDRHPTMSDHPVTPMTESDLRRHLGEQTDRPSALVDLRDVADGVEAVDAAAPDPADADGEVVAYDATTRVQLATVGAHLRERARDLPDGRHLFVVGSSGVEYALADGWTDGSAAGSDGVGGRDRIVVTSGSASPETAAQIDYATRHGFTGVRLDTRRLLDPDEADDAVEAAVSTAREALSEGSSPLLYTAKGPDDPAIVATTDHADSLGLSSETAGRRLGRGVGAALRRLLSETSLDRACVAGGDTCGHAVPELGVRALTTATPLSPGAPLCEAHADADEFDGIEIALKGGQLGDERYFGRVRDGEPEQG